MIEISQIERKSLLLPPVRDYLVGVAHTNPSLPENILLFNRCDRRLLRESHDSFHHRFVLVVNLRSPGSIQVDQKLIHLAEGHVVLIFPNQFHRYVHVRQGPLHWLFITFELKHPESMRSLKNLALNLQPQSLQLLHDLIDTGNRLLPGQQGVSNRLALQLALLLDELQVEARRPPGNQATEKSDTRNQLLVERVHLHLLNHVEEGWTIRQLAFALKLSESHLRSVFRDELGMSLGHYMSETRMARAAALIHNTDSTLAEIAEACGFSSAYAFSRAFKRHFRHTPSQYRLLVRQGRPPL